MNKEGANKLLEEAKKSFENRTRWHQKLWRWVRNRCPLCNAKLEIKLSVFNSIKTCSRCPNYRPYVGELNFVPILLILIVIMAITILTLVSMQRDRKIREKGEIYHEPAIYPH